MSLIQTLKRVQKDCERVLNGLSAVDGDTLNKSELAKLSKDRVVYWMNKASIEDTSRSTFISVKVPNAPILAKGDNKIAFRRGRAYIDVVTLKSNTDPKLLTILENIEAAFEAEGYEFDMVREAELDTRTARTIWSFEISKIL